MASKSAASRDIMHYVAKRWRSLAYRTEGNQTRDDGGEIRIVLEDAATLREEGRRLRQLAQAMTDPDVVLQVLALTKEVERLAAKADRRAVGGD